MEERFEIREIWKDDSFYSVLWDNEKAETKAVGYGTDNIVDLLNEQDEKIKELESQVAKWKQDYENCSGLEKLITKERQYCLENWRECEEENKQLKQSQNSKAIEELQKVKDYLLKEANNSDEISFVEYVIDDYIDNQITELKEKSK